MESEKIKRGAGRPKEKVLPKILAKLNDISVLERMASKLTDLDMAEVLDIPLPTYKKYKRNKEFLETIKKGLDQRVDSLQNSLLRRAIGFYYDELVEELVPVVVDKKGKKGFKIEKKLILTKKTKKYLSSDTAAIFLLRNYRPELFNKKYGDSSTGDGNDKININILYKDNREAFT